MTRVAFISDLHAEHRTLSLMRAAESGWRNFSDFGFPEELDADLIIVPGDIHANPAILDRFINGIQDSYGIPTLFVAGNHDCYGRPMPDVDGWVQDIGGVRVAGSTLWTHLDEAARQEALTFLDFKKLPGLTLDRWNAVHARQAQFLLEAQADIIVTHHAPTLGSLHPRFAGKGINPFYVNELDLGLYTGTKLWVHGHVHDEWDFIESGIRVVCNPLGYPHEAHRHGTQVKIVDI